MLKPLHWTDPQKADLGNYSGTEVIQFHKNSGPYRASQRIEASQLQADGYQLRPEHFSVYLKGEIALAAGDRLRLTGNAKDETGKHKLDNGRSYTVAGFTPAGIRLNNGWVVKNDVGLIAHDYVRTSFGGQGRTVDRVLVAMGRESRPAIDAATFYVSGSRRESCTIYSNLAWPLLREAVQRVQQRKSATELMQQPAPGPLRPDSNPLCGTCDTSTSSSATRRGRWSRPPANARRSGSGELNMADDFLKEFRRRDDRADSGREAEGLPQSDGEYRAHGRAAAQPLYTLHCLLGASGCRSFQYVHLDSDSSFCVDRQSQVIRLRFGGLLDRRDNSGSEPANAVRPNPSAPDALGNGTGRRPRFH